MRQGIRWKFDGSARRDICRSFSGYHSSGQTHNSKQKRCLRIESRRYQQHSRCSQRARAVAAKNCNPGAQGNLETERFLDSIKWDPSGLVAVMAQDIDTGEILMQAFSDRAGIHETLRTKLATFYSRSRKERWCKGETSGNYIHVKNVYLDCDRDSIIYLGEPDGPSCHTGAHTCWYSEATLQDEEIVEGSDQVGRQSSPLPSLLTLQQTIQKRREAAELSGNKPSWTAKLLQNPDLLCSKIREEAGELCQTLEDDESQERTASEMADLLYHSMVLLNAKGVEVKEVFRLLRSRFDQSGIDEKASRPKKK